jgi:hypothetical protein
VSKTKGCSQPSLKRCPFCGQQYSLDLTVLEAKIYFALLAMERLTSRQLIESCYGKRADGGPLYPHITLNLTKNKINRKIAKLKQKIVCTHKRHLSTYRLVTHGAL